MSDTYSSSVDKVLAPLGQKLLVLSGDNTQNLLSGASGINRADAAALLERLKQLNPVIGAQFQPKNDVFSELRLRLITTQQAAPRGFSSFIIISYCWHYPEWPLAPAAKPVAPGWEISRPMVDVTMKLRDSAEEGVWLDKLCINQNDDMEKKVHIGVMDFIYRSARRVIILLEDVQLNKEEEDAGLVYAGFYDRMCRKVREEKLEGTAMEAFVESYFSDQEDLLPDKAATTAAIRLFVMRILDARWFSRAWCAHESRVSPHPKQNNPLFLCYGHDGRVLTFEFRYVHYIATHLEQASESEISLDGTNFSELQQQCWRIQRILPSVIQNRSIMQHICSIVLSGCLKKEDLISIALNTSNTPLVFTGHIETVEDAVWIFALVVIAAGDLIPLILNGDRLKLVDAVTKQGTISWLGFPEEGVYHKTSQMPLKDSITAVTGDYIELDLILFPSLPVKASEEALNIAHKIFEEIDPSGMAQITSDVVQKHMEIIRTEVIRRMGDDGMLKRAQIEWLGHAIDCGLEWTVRFPDSMVRETQEGGWDRGLLGQSADARLSKAAESLFAYFAQNGLVAGSDEEAGLKHNLTRFLTCILDPRFTLMVTTRTRRLPCGPGDFIFMTRPSNRSWIAVPTALMHLPCWEDRAWVIEPFDTTEAPEDPRSHLPYIDVDDSGVNDIRFPVLPSDSKDNRGQRLEAGTWKLRSRTSIIGPKPLVNPTNLRQDGEGILLLKKQRVHGAKDYDWTAMSAVIKELKAQQESSRV